MHYKFRSASGVEEIRAVRQIPGVRCRVRETVACAGAADAVAAILGPPLEAINDAPRAVRGAETVKNLIARALPHQRVDAEALARGEKNLLWVTTGGGKTATALWALSLLNPVPPALVITRSTGRLNWAMDALWAGDRRVAVLRGRTDGPTQRADAKRAQKAIRAASGAPVIVTASVAEALLAGANTLVMGWELFDAERVRAKAGAEGSSLTKTGGARLRELLEVSWGALILDEHHMGKHWTTIRAKAVESLAGLIPVVWGLTATPIPDKLRDLFTQLCHVSSSDWRTFVDANEYGIGDWSKRDDGKEDWKPAFSIRYCHGMQGKYGWEDDGPHAPGTCIECDTGFRPRVANELQPRLALQASARSRTDLAASLPAKRRMITWLDDADLASRRKAAVAAKDSPTSREKMIAYAAELKTAVALQKAIDEMLSGGKIIVTGNRIKWVDAFAAEVKAACAKSKALKSAWVQVAASDAGDRELQVAEYQALSRPACFVSTHQKIGESANLHMTSRLLVVALLDTPRELIQLDGRVGRIGGWPVIVEFLAARGTVDEPLVEALYSKLAVVDAAGANTHGSVETDGLKMDEAAVADAVSEYLRRAAGSDSVSFGESED